MKADAAFWTAPLSRGLPDVDAAETSGATAEKETLDFRRVPLACAASAAVLTGGRGVDAPDGAAEEDRAATAAKLARLALLAAPLSPDSEPSKASVLTTPARSLPACRANVHLTSSSFSDVPGLLVAATDAVAADDVRAAGPAGVTLSQSRRSSWTISA